jgi:2-polyprenyl-3-methyl-5-hydroxy-6-metoxy-1,4-benzoquinol methylase
MELIDESGAFDGLACPLCAGRVLSVVLHDAGRRYFRCARCDLVSVHPDDRPTRIDESERYLAHENDATDEGYVHFLRRLADPVCAVVEVGSRGLDVGCGPTPVLATLLTEGGRPTQWYDPLFFPRHELLFESYDFVTCSEVAEHAHDPAALFRQLVGLLRRGGTLGVMTSMHDDATDFESWWYRRDITHVCFYSVRTMEWVAEHYDLALSLPATNVALFTLRSGQSQSM